MIQEGKRIKFLKVRGSDISTLEIRPISVYKNPFPA